MNLHDEAVVELRRMARLLRKKSRSFNGSYYIQSPSDALVEAAEMCDRRATRIYRAARKGAR